MWLFPLCFVFRLLYWIERTWYRYSTKIPFEQGKVIQRCYIHTQWVHNVLIVYFISSNFLFSHSISFIAWLIKMFANLMQCWTCFSVQRKLSKKVFKGRWEYSIIIVCCTYFAGHFRAKKKVNDRINILFDFKIWGLLL